MLWKSSIADPVGPEQVTFLAMVLCDRGPMLSLCPPNEELIKRVPYACVFTWDAPVTVFPAKTAAPVNPVTSSLDAKGAVNPWNAYGLASR